MDYPIGVFPTRSELLLLKAALQKGEEAITAWHSWARNEQNRLEGPPVVRIIPQLYLNLSRLGVDAPQLSVLKRQFLASHSAHWVYTRLLLDCLRLLQKEGFETLVLKGAALARSHYSRLGARWIGDVDFLTRTSDFYRCFELLCDHGWRPKSGVSIRSIDPRFRSAVNLFNREGLSIDLHGHVLHHTSKAAADTPFWDAAVPLVIDGLETVTLCDTDHLIHVCYHGMQWKKIKPLQWVMDSFLILSKPETEVDWERLTGLAEGLGVTSQLHMTLSFLQQEFSLPVPLSAIGALASTQQTPLKKRFADLQMVDKAGKPLRTLRFHRCRYHLFLQQNPGIGPLIALRLYFGFWLGTDRLRMVPLLLLSKLWRVISYQLGFYKYPD